MSPLTVSFDIEQLGVCKHSRSSVIVFSWTWLSSWTKWLLRPLPIHWIDQNCPPNLPHHVDGPSGFGSQPPRGEINYIILPLSFSSLLPQSSLLYSCCHHVDSLFLGFRPQKHSGCWHWVWNWNITSWPTTIIIIQYCHILTSAVVIFVIFQTELTILLPIAAVLRVCY